jgi:hypothetical protein
MLNFRRTNLHLLEHLLQLLSTRIDQLLVLQKREI